jgi:hypothetical protein
MTPLSLWIVIVCEALLAIGLFWEVARLRRLQEMLETEKSQWLNDIAQIRREVKSSKNKVLQVCYPSMVSLLGVILPKTSPWALLLKLL